MFPPFWVGCLNPNYYDNYDRQKTFVRESDGIIHLNVEIPNKQNTVRICNKLIQKPHPPKYDCGSYTIRSRDMPLGVV